MGIEMFVEEAHVAEGDQLTDVIPEKAGAEIIFPKQAKSQERRSAPATERRQRSDELLRRHGGGIRRYFGKQAPIVAVRVVERQPLVELLTEELVESLEEPLAPGPCLSLHGTLSADTIVRGDALVVTAEVPTQSLAEAQQSDSLPGPTQMWAFSPSPDSIDGEENMLPAAAEEYVMRPPLLTAPDRDRAAPYRPKATVQPPILAALQRGSVRGARSRSRSLDARREGHMRSGVFVAEEEDSLPGPTQMWGCIGCSPSRHSAPRSPATYERCTAADLANATDRGCGDVVISPTLSFHLKGPWSPALDAGAAAADLVGAAAHRGSEAAPLSPTLSFHLNDRA